MFNIVYTYICIYAMFQRLLRIQVVFFLQIYGSQQRKKVDRHGSTVWTEAPRWEWSTKIGRWEGWFVAANKGNK